MSGEMENYRIGLAMSDQNPFKRALIQEYIQEVDKAGSNAGEKSKKLKLEVKPDPDIQIVSTEPGNTEADQDSNSDAATQGLDSQKS